MAFQNGGTYYGFTSAELDALRSDGDYNDIVSLFDNDNIGFTVTIGSETYRFVSSSDLPDPMGLIGRIDDDLTPPGINITLDSAVYYSGYGFMLM